MKLCQLLEKLEYCIFTIYDVNEKEINISKTFFDEQIEFAIEHYGNYEVLKINLIHYDDYGDVSGELEITINYGGVKNETR